MAKVSEIVSLKEKLEAKDAARNAAYDLVVKHYGGSTLYDRKKQGSWIKAALSSLIAQHSNEDNVEPVMRVNLTRPAVLAKMAYMGLPSTIRVPAPPARYFTEAQPIDNPNAEPMDPEQQAMAFADNMERAYLGHWNFSHMEMRYRDAGWYHGAMGSCVWGVWPDIRHKRPRIITLSPQYFYAVPYDSDGFELATALWVEKLNGHEVMARWGQFNSKLRRYEDADEVEVLHYVDEGQYSTIVDNKIQALDDIENKVGLVPFAISGNIGVPGSIYGDDEVSEGIEVEKEINFQIAMLDDQARKCTDPTIFAQNTNQLPENFALGEGGVIEGGPDANVTLLTPPGPGHQVMQLVEMLQNWYDLITDNPAQLRGQGFGSILTGKGFNASLSPIASRLSQKRLAMDAAVSQVNRYLMLMWWKFPEFNKKSVTLSGRKGKDYFYMEASPNDFVLDGQMWTENEVFLSAQSFVDRQGTDVEIMQLRQQNPPLVSWDTAVEALPYVDDKARERKRIESDVAWMASLQMAAQQPPQNAESQAYAMERGATQTSPAGSQPTTPQGQQAPPVGAGVEESAPAPDESQQLVSELTDLIGSIPRLKGRVWLAGGALNGDITLGIDIFVEVAADKATIINAIRKTQPELVQPSEAFPDGMLHFHTSEPNSDEQSVLVSGNEEMGGMGDEEIMSALGAA